MCSLKEMFLASTIETWPVTDHDCMPLIYFDMAIGHTWQLDTEIL